MRTVVWLALVLLLVVVALLVAGVGEPALWIVTVTGALALLAISGRRPSDTARR
jgi:hypothetical protein